MTVEHSQSTTAIRFPACVKPWCLTMNVCRDSVIAAEAPWQKRIGTRQRVTERPSPLSLKDGRRPPGSGSVLRAIPSRERRWAGSCPLTRSSHPRRFYNDQPILACFSLGRGTLRTHRCAIQSLPEYLWVVYEVEFGSQHQFSFLVKSQACVFFFN